MHTNTNNDAEELMQAYLVKWEFWPTDAIHDLYCEAEACADPKQKTLLRKAHNLLADEINKTAKSKIYKHI